jgi:Bacterial archaeo-eukaryotic release factor family 11
VPDTEQDTTHGLRLPRTFGLARQLAQLCPRGVGFDLSALSLQPQCQNAVCRYPYRLGYHRLGFFQGWFVRLNLLAHDSIIAGCGSDSIQFKNLAKEAIRELTEAGADKSRMATLSEHLDGLIDDPEFWRFQANSLAVLATPSNIRTFRAASALSPSVVVSDRFFLKPLLRAVSFRNSCYVLALAEGSVRLVEVSADLPATAIKVEGLPKDAKNAAGRSTVINRSMGRLQGGEGQKVLFRQYARRVHAALRDLLAGSDLPLILAANEPLASIYPSVNTYPHLPGHARRRQRPDYRRRTRGARAPFA